MAARERILAAVETLIAEGGLRAVSIASAAAGAGVSRQTVYAHFRTREEMIADAISELSARVLGALVEKLEEIADAGDYVVEVLVSGRAAFRTTPALAVLLFPESGNPMFDTEVLAQAVPFAEVFIGPVFAKAPELESCRDEVVETILRFGLSVLTFDSDLIRTDDQLRGYLTRSLLPAIGLGRGPSAWQDWASPPS